MFNMLDRYNNHRDIKKMTLEELDCLATDIRNFLIEKVSKTGGHLASNLGVVELTLSLFNVFDMDRDKVIWDVGHQSYVYKVLTGRKEQFDTLRQTCGISGFPKRNESIYDFFETGHSSTSISAALGMARARDLKRKKHNVIAVIGDGALTGGMALEALNDVGYRKTNLIIVLNDNQMSIDKNVGGLSTYLSKLRVDPSYNKLKQEFNSTMERTSVGKGIVYSINKIKDSIKQIVVPEMFFEDIGIKYLGPIDGHNIREMSKVMDLAKEIQGPVLIHAITQKGKGYDFAEKNPNKFHGIGPFNCNSGELSFISGDSYSKNFGEELVDIAKEDENVVAITAAMPDGTGLKKFAELYPERFFDVGIAEQHAVTLAAGMAAAGLKPVFAVYSTFLQRAFDQVLHDVCIQKLPVIFAIDRAGIVGEDGETHQGVFDISYLSCIPNITILAPKCMGELKSMLRWSTNQDFPIAIRYPRGGDLKDIVFSPLTLEKIQKGKWEILRKGKDVAIIATGKMVQIAEKAALILEDKGVKVSLINACFIKPIDKKMIKDLVEENKLILTLEDNVTTGGLGTQILSYINTLNSNIKFNNLGFKDEFINQGDMVSLYKNYNLHPEGIVKSVLEML
ncbi:1-deoxy-D-xylulose-5-phosphate synthase [Clostridium sp. MSJ-4]|uniref:1-deoxy-D-xylulose-5-phosphate synthase n=1 Tax=Clostridium simiarum TaxID=2841506 RepID=A0ABS6EWZ5_9CLOT|nr:MULTISPECIES: 1-deoxy-D-xylulose-5-phosphate synthase [Clostridium]MBU5590746.1 1-deoxy-D-xylulose-5-phosphate synthase [Clostridium simiarum]